MERSLVSDGLWRRVAPLLSRHFTDPRAGQPRADSRPCLARIVFVLMTGIPWSALPGERGVGGPTCWLRLRDWTAAGMWDRLHEGMLAEFNARGMIHVSLSVEQARVAQFRCLRVRHERRADVHQACLSLGVILIGFGSRDALFCKGDVA